MVGTPISQVRRLINQGPIQDLSRHYCPWTFEMAKEQERKVELPIAAD